jgi:glycosyltransferase involved in cell wall biosynthesis
MPVAPPVGVVIPNHDTSAFVVEAIESVAHQTVRDLQVVVVDDASTDRSDAVIRDCLDRLGDSRFRYVKNDDNLGQFGSVRRGLALLSTPFVCFLDSDDVWYDRFVERHLTAHLNTDFPVAMTFCDSHVIDGAGRMLAGTAWWFDSKPNEPPERTIDFSLIPALDPTTGTLSYPAKTEVSLRTGWTPAAGTNSTASMMFRRSFVDLVLVPEVDTRLRLSVDYYLSTLAYLLTGVIAVHEPLYAYRMHGSNKHSNLGVPGGPYNTSEKPWQSVRDPVLEVVLDTLRSQATHICRVFGEDRHAEALSQVEQALAKPEPEIEEKRESLATVLRRKLPPLT